MTQSSDGVGPAPSSLRLWSCWWTRADDTKQGPWELCKEQNWGLFEIIIRENGKKQRNITLPFNCVNVKRNIPVFRACFHPVIPWFILAARPQVCCVFVSNFLADSYKHLETPAASAKRCAVLMLKGVWEKLAADCVDWTTTAPAHLTSEHGQVLRQLPCTPGAALAGSCAPGEEVWKEHLCLWAGRFTHGN